MFKKVIYNNSTYYINPLNICYIRVFSKYEISIHFNSERDADLDLSFMTEAERTTFLKEYLNFLKQEKREILS